VWSQQADPPPLPINPLSQLPHLIMSSTQHCSAFKMLRIQFDDLRYIQRELSDNLSCDSRTKGKKDGDALKDVGKNVAQVVFKLKKQQLIKDTTSENIFGRVIARNHSIEFQKRGSPQMHITVWLEGTNHLTETKQSTMEAEYVHWHKDKKDAVDGLLYTHTKKMYDPRGKNGSDSQLQKDQSQNVGLRELLHDSSPDEDSDKFQSNLRSAIHLLQNRIITGIFHFRSTLFVKE
jgi:hypothetical protein